jgi:hypothetical protein
MRLGEGKVVDKDAPAEAESKSGPEDRPVYGANLLEESEKKKKVTEKSSSKGKILSKADILMGKEKRITVHLDHYDKDVVIRPLTDGELSRVFDVIGNVPLNENGLPDLNMVDISTNLRALRMITAMGLVEPEMSEDDVSEMRFGTPGILAKHILEISGLSETAGDETEKFRSDA